MHQTASLGQHTSSSEEISGEGVDDQVLGVVAGARNKSQLPFCVVGRGIASLALRFARDTLAYVIWEA